MKQLATLIVIGTAFSSVNAMEAKQDDGFRLLQKNYFTVMENEQRLTKENKELTEALGKERIEHQKLERVFKENEKFYAPLKGENEMLWQENFTLSEKLKGQSALASESVKLNLELENSHKIKFKELKDTNEILSLTLRENKKEFEETCHDRDQKFAELTEKFLVLEDENARLKRNQKDLLGDEPKEDNPDHEIAFLIEENAGLKEELQESKRQIALYKQQLEILMNPIAPEHNPDN